MYKPANRRLFRPIKAHTPPNRWQHLLWVCFPLILLIGCDVKSVDPVVKIGLVAPFDGEQRDVGYDVIYSARLAVRQINEAGGLNGTRVSLVAYDDSSSTEEAQRVAEALIIDPSVVAVIGHWNPETTAAVESMYKEAGLTLIAMDPAHLWTTDPALLPEDFRQAYTAITYQGAQPPGIYAGTTYDGMQLIFESVERDSRFNDKVTRSGIHTILPDVVIQGMTGDIQLAP